MNSPTSPTPSDDHHSMSRRAAVFGGFTLLSRIAGLVRDMVIARTLGTGLGADAFYVAFRIPNLLRRLLAEGAMTMGFVPIYTRYKRTSQAEGERTASVLFSVLLVLNLVLLVAGLALSPWLVSLVAKGFTQEPDKFALTVELTRIMFPYLALVSLMALLMGMLQTERHFTAPAAAPIFLNLIMIAATLWLAPFFAQPTIAVAIGVVLGGLAQLAVQVPPLLKRSKLPRLTFNWRHPSVREFVQVMIPSIYGGAVYQLNVLVITRLASYLPEGSVTYLWYADRITEFPLGIFAVALATVTLPALSDHHARQDYPAFKATLQQSLRMAIAEAMPATVGLIALATPIVRLLFERGKFSAASTAGTVAALYGFALGIPWISLVRNLVPAFYALHKPRAPVIAGTVALMVNVVFALLLKPRFAHQGLALAMAIAGVSQFIFLFIWLKRLIGSIGGAYLLQRALRCTLASGIMGAVVWSIAHLAHAETITQRSHLAFVVLGDCLVGIFIYALALRYIARDEYHHLVAMIRRRRSRST